MTGDVAAPGLRLATTASPHADDGCLRFLVDGVRGFAVFTLDTEGQVAGWNLGAEGLLGYVSEEIVGRGVAGFYAAGRTPGATAGAGPDHGQQSSGRHEEETWWVRKDGSCFPARVVITALRDPGGELVGFGAVSRDLTDQRRHTPPKHLGFEAPSAGAMVMDEWVDQLRTLHAELEHRVEERTAELQATLEEREVLLQEVHHRVKNNLQLISSLINMQVRALGNDASRAGALRECQTRVQAMALIHEKLYQSKDYTRVPFSEYARSLAANVFHATGVSPEGVALELHIEDAALAVDKAIPCGLILNELITNALKHAFPGGRSGTIRVELTTASDGASFGSRSATTGWACPRGSTCPTLPPSACTSCGCWPDSSTRGSRSTGRRGTCFRLTIPVGP